MGGRRRSDDSSSGEEDGPTEWKAALNSIVATTSFGAKTISQSTEFDDSEDDGQIKPQKPKHYQIKAQKILEDILEKNLEMVKDPVHAPDNDPLSDDSGVRLFKQSKPGIVFDHIDELQGPKKKPRILPGEEIDLDSKKMHE